MYTNNLHMNKVHIETHNPIFQTVHELCNRYQYIHYLARYLSESNRTTVSIREDSTKNIYNKENDIKDVSTRNFNMWIYKDNNKIKLYKCTLYIAVRKKEKQNNDEPKSTEDKVYSAVVSPVTKCCLMMALMWL
jgi:hypothetical protein